jgi:DNA-binding LacI/PurR family transcriptional regulator/DNA-binding transcriptional regulator YhcF (GntR family)
MRRHSVVQEIQGWIATGKLQQGARLPSERQLAIELGASRTAIQGALKELESLGIVSRQANCRPTISVQPPKPHSVDRPAADQIAIWLLPKTQDLGGLMMLQGIRTAFSERDYCLLITSPPAYDTDSIQRAELQFLKAAKSNPRVAGVITWDAGNPECHQAYQDLVDSGVPLVFVDRRPLRLIAADLVATNHRRAAYQAVSYLIELGHRSIAMVIANDRASSVLDRIDGYKSALRDHDLEIDPSHMLHLNTREPGVDARSDEIVERLAQGENAPTAVFAVNDHVGFHLMESAKRVGVAVPERLSVIGFDWLAKWMPSGGDLSTVAQPFEEIGRAAAHRVLDRIAEPGATSREILFDAQLVLRSSTAKPVQT